MEEGNGREKERVAGRGREREREREKERERGRERKRERERERERERPCEKRPRKKGEHPNKAPALVKSPLFIAGATFNCPNMLIE